MVSVQFEFKARISGNGIIKVVMMRSLKLHISKNK